MFVPPDAHEPTEPTLEQNLKNTAESRAARITAGPERLAFVLLVVSGVVCLFQAASTIRRLTSATTVVEVGLQNALLTCHGERIAGVVNQHLPPYRLQWDGQPPRVTLVRKPDGRVVAAQVLSLASLYANRNAVVWTPRDGYKLTEDRCEFVLAVQSCGDKQHNLALRFEVPPSRAGLFLWGFAAAALFAISLIVHIANGIAQASPSQTVTMILLAARRTAFVLLSVTAFVILFPGPPWLSGDTDAASIHSFAAATDHPEAFRRDALLGDPSNFTYYTPLYVMLARAANAAGLPYETSRALLGAIATWIGLTAYNRLFSLLAGSRLVGFIASLAVWLLSAGYPPNEHWAFPMGLPRAVFAALMPVVLLLTLRVRHRPGLWWQPAAASGLLFNVHPASSPALTAAILAGLILVPSASIREKVRGAVVATLAAIVTMAPFALFYATRRVAYAGQGEHLVGELAKIMPAFAPREFFRASLHMILFTPRYWLLCAGLCALALWCRTRPAVRVFLGMLLGFALVAFVMPTIDWSLADRFGRMPSQIGLIRNIRYIDVVLMTTVVLAARYLPHRTTTSPLILRVTCKRGPKQLLDGRFLLSTTQLRACAVILACFFLTFTTTLRSVIVGLEESTRALSGHPSEVPAARLELLYALRSLRGNDQRALVPFDLDFVREYGVPLALTWKDPDTLSWTHPLEMIKSQRLLDRANTILAGPVTGSRIEELANLMKAEIIVIERWRAAPDLQDDPRLLFANSRYLAFASAPGSSSFLQPTHQARLRWPGAGARDAGVTRPPGVAAVPLWIEAGGDA
ncbi:MAG TPA: hypothetical protein VHR45_06695 [Thermoanaerobaculia bacterium]|nr:hypothetical protein [Thermoanaerobaculia bacterium]